MNPPKQTRFYGDENGLVYDSKPTGKTPWQEVRDLPGHGNARHGSQTTNQQQITRLKTGIAPDGETAPTSKATKFNSYLAELDAVKRAELKAIEMETNGTTPSKVISSIPSGSNAGRGRLPRFEITVGGKVSYGEGYTSKDPITGIVHPANLGVHRPVFPTGQNPNAKVVMQYDPASKSWKPFTQYPTDEPETP